LTNSFATQLTLNLERDRDAVEQELLHVLDETVPRGRNPVQEAMRYAALGPGKRVRPVLSLRVARLLNTGSALVSRAALSVELVHCASLIIDDLPCMDNDKERRGRPAVHVAYGEATAILAAFGLVALAARLPAEHSEAGASLQARSRVAEFQLHLLRTLDTAQLIGGQDLDLRLSGSDRDRHRDHMNDLKTVPLFRLAIRAGLISAEIPASFAETLVSFGAEFGRAFQHMDDHLDNESPTLTPFVTHLERASEHLKPLNGSGLELQDLLEYLGAQARQSRCHYR
jgi:farnesyl diphosphate synthase